MGITTSVPERDLLSQASWLVSHGGLASPWSRFTLSRYGAGISATGLAASVAVPQLLRTRLQDWAVLGLAVRLGPDCVAFGRELGSLSRREARMFYGVDIRFGEHGRGSWLWYCRSNEWLLQLHQATLEPLPASLGAEAGIAGHSAASAAVAPGVTAGGNAAAGNTNGEGSPLAAGLPDQRWPGRPRYLDEDVQQAAAKGGHLGSRDSCTASTSPRLVLEGGGGRRGVGIGGQGAAAPDAAVAAAPPVPGSPEAIEQQLALLLSNADGHVGLLCLPVPRDQAEAVASVVAQWRTSCTRPLVWSGRQWSTAEDFRQLRETALNMPDLLLLGLETELAMALTPDWTWEKYPRGFGEAPTAAEPRPIEEDRAR